MEIESHRGSWQREDHLVAIGPRFIFKMPIADITNRLQQHDGQRTGYIFYRGTIDEFDAFCLAVEIHFGEDVTNAPVPRLFERLLGMLRIDSRLTQENQQDTVPVPLRTGTTIEINGDSVVILPRNAPPVDDTRGFTMNVDGDDVFILSRRYGEERGMDKSIYEELQCLERKFFGSQYDFNGGFPSPLILRIAKLEDMCKLRRDPTLKLKGRLGRIDEFFRLFGSEITGVRKKLYGMYTSEAELGVSVPPQGCGIIPFLESVEELFEIVADRHDTISDRMDHIKRAIGPVD